MGNNSSRRGSSPEEVSERRPKRRRRLRDVGGGVDDVASDEESEEGAISPKRARIQATSTYIYETLYQQGIGTDITLIALEKEWKLHKVYLCQSRYFASMFSGNWKESDQSIIHLDIPDPNITEECLNIAFTSLYKDSIHLSSSLIPGIVAAATMFQLDGLLQHCIEYMKETLCSAHMLKYLNTASQYGLHDIEKKCQDWLQTRLLTDFTIPLLLDMSLELLTELIKSPDLFVLQVETDVYSLAKKWLFLHLNPTWDGSLSKLTSSAEAFYREKSEGVYLETEEGRQYQELFRSIRLRHIINDSASVAVLENDKIIPQDWLLPLYRHQWLKMVTVDQRLDHGPVSLTKDDFNDNAIRCGRILQKSDEYCWRWTGFLFGVDILLIYKDGLISVKRNTRSQPCLAAVSLQNERSLTFRLRVVSFSKNEEVCSSQDTGIVHLTLAPDECSLSKLTSSAEAFFRERSEGVYLETEEGRQYQELFRSICLRHIINDSASVAVLENDKIIPQDWMLPLYRHQWLKMVTVDQRLDHGPVSLTKDDFNDNAIRCDHILQISDEYCWRWTGFLFGVDILLIYKDGLISVKRNTRSQPCLAAISLQNERSLTFRDSLC